MSKTKGIAIRVPVDLLKKIKDHSLPRNELCNQALIDFFEKINTMKSESSDTISDELYDQVYNAIYNTEMVPVNKQMEEKQKLIEALQEEISEYRDDKRFLKDQILNLQMEKKSRFSLFKKKKQ